MTFEQAFSKIKEKFVKADASKAADFAMQITLTDEDCGGTLYAAVKDGVLAVEPYDYHDNTSVLNITKSALLALLSGRQSLDKAIADGEASVQGDASNVAELKSTIKKAAKTPAKKAAAKTAKKTTTTKKAASKTAKSTAKTTAKAAPAKEAKATAAKPAPAKTAKSAAVKPASVKEAPKAAAIAKETAKTATVAKTAAKTTK